jgi:ATP-dependent RNA helicase DeaD
VPDGKEICEKQLFNLIDKVEWVDVDESTIAPYLDIIDKKLAWLPREELIKRFVWVEFNRFLTYYKDAADINVKAVKGMDRSEGKDKRGRNADWKDGHDRSKRKPDPNLTRFHINLGSKNRLSKIDLISLINEQTGNKSIEIGKIEVMKTFSIFELEKNFEKQLLKAFADVHRDGIKVKVEVSKNAVKPDAPKRFKKKKERVSKKHRR